MRTLRPELRSDRVSLNALALCCAFGCASGTVEPPGDAGVGGTGAAAGSAGVGSTGGAVSGSGGSAGTATGTGGTGATGATGGTAPGVGGTTSSGGSGNAGSGAGNAGSGAGSVDCDRIEDAGHEVCESSDAGCTAVFTDGSGCTAVCAAAGLTCTAAFDNAEGECAASNTGTELACDSGHESDFCLCGGPVTGAGGSSGTGGSASTGGSTNTGGSSTTGGSSGSVGSSGSSGTGGTGQQPDVGPAPCGCTSPAGEYGTIDESIVVRSGEVWDGQCQIVRADRNALGDGTQAEGQKPVFIIEDGGTLRNVILGASAADGIHTEGDATIENVHWQDIGEDALTIKGEGTVNLNCGSAQNGDDKVFQINAASTFNITNFTARSAGKMVRQNGGTTFTINVTIDHCDISNMGEVIFRTDSGSSRVTMTNSRYSDIADGLFMFGSSVVDGNSDRSTVSNNAEY